MKKSILLLFILFILFSFSPLKTNARNDDYDKSRWSIAAGVGVSYGGLGLRGQWRSKGITAFGAHVGLGKGLHDQPEAVGAIGAKFFLYKGIYLGYVYGSVGGETMRSSSSTGASSYEQTVHYGSALLSGIDWTWGKKTQFGVNAAFGFAKKPKYKFFPNSSKSNLAPVIDIGFIVKF